MKLTGLSKVDADPVDTRSRNKGTSDRKSTNSEPPNKRKRDPKDEDGDDSKLQEFLTAMQPSSKSKTWADSGLDRSAGAVSSAANGKSDDIAPAAAESEAEPQKKNKRLKSDQKVAFEAKSVAAPEPGVSTDTGPEQADSADSAQDGPPEVEEDAPKSDADWLRSKTSRLLGLVDEEEETEAPSRPVATASSPILEDFAERDETQAADVADDDSSSEEEEVPDPNIEMIRKTGRLFLRNLPYNATEGDLQPLFSPFGKTEEVRTHIPVAIPSLVVLAAISMMNILIGTSDAMHMM